MVHISKRYFTSQNELDNAKLLLPENCSSEQDFAMYNEYIMNNSHYAHFDSNGYLHGEDTRVGWFFHGTKMDCSTQNQFDRIVSLKVFW